MGWNGFVYLLDEHSRWWAFWLYQATPPYDGGAMVTVRVPL